MLVTSEVLRESWKCEEGSPAAQVNQQVARKERKNPVANQAEDWTFLWACQLIHLTP